jgi:nicotinamidase-related amidase
MQALLVVDMITDFVKKGAAVDCGDDLEFRIFRRLTAIRFAGWKRHAGRRSSEPQEK